MEFFKIAMLVNGLLWIAALAFLVYAIGESILALNPQQFIAAAILFILATVAQLALSILSDGH